MDFLQSLPAGYRYAFEFRDDSWFEEPIETLLSERGAAFCIYDFAGRESPHFVTSDFVYMRLHGPAEPYKNRYERKMLSRWADSIMRWVNEGKDVFCYFDNDEMAYAVENASTLKQMIKL
jgi:uncharacterized protein YecE (DUF72 family)